MPATCDVDMNTRLVKRCELQVFDLDRNPVLWRRLKLVTFSFLRNCYPHADTTSSTQNTHSVFSKAKHAGSGSSPNSPAFKFFLSWPSTPFLLQTRVRVDRWVVGWAIFN